MRRREVIKFAGGAAISWPLIARAQQLPMPVIGFLHSGSPSSSVPSPAPEYRLALSQAGYTEGQNVAFEHLWAAGNYDRLPTLATELVHRQVAVIVAIGWPAALAAKAATATIPIVFWSGGDPVKEGLVASLNRPGGNLTGVGMFNNELTAKRLELLRELVPKAAVFAMLVNPTSPNTEGQLRDAQEAARPTGIQIRVLGASSDNEIDAAFVTLANERPGALIVAADIFLYNQRERLIRLTEKYSVPAIYTVRAYAVAGGLISYASSASMDDALGSYTGRILKGEKPAELPVQQPSRFQMVINLKTAKALGLTIPPTLLTRADEVIE